MSFEFEIAGRGDYALLKVREGCWVRVRDVSVIGLGMATPEGEELIADDTVVVNLAFGTYVEFDACPNTATAVEMTGQLARAIAAHQA